ncbi:ribonuclease HII [candidate division WOR-1 bacterium RIFOXYC2_FULL_37_10]|uniref:Ribonuclease HII n=1 Tax=candidate division WOR-1 bacterium RIFOXYB2_FULL_37_13 TaxID=1802579 RepID=A0A1F4SDS1_UNCSA|nr:MAG: ribonuclease HII [candidate division WOR-1 bacterium RIFOXYA2_FULL_37_7]OGC18559.1 MAG: ribonuclease HII [candidate division WOR-1 bacterium RIFOXYB2_FULL_37_13]OGC36877.1 MAG: ribonuclease HII [candidate division WOR-1 bacterium RIFOXYC2_FULL_37_10]
MPDTKWENYFRKKGYQLVAGVDEAGRGPLAGPVIAAAVILPLRHRIKGLDDSKKLSAKQREALFPLIQKKAISIGVGIVGPKTIDRINILNASLYAMRLAIEQLAPQPHFILIDGKFKIISDIAQKCLVKGDSISDSIAAASIIAKVSRDKIMKKYDEVFPQYGFKSHKGYGTKKHIEEIFKNGPCEIHRQSFDPVRTLAERL